MYQSTETRWILPPQRQVTSCGIVPARRARFSTLYGAVGPGEIIRKFYQRLESQGKAFKIAITACMRKMPAYPKHPCEE